MIEVVFSDSAKGSMKVAKRYIKGKRKIGEDKKADSVNSEENKLVGIVLNLDRGDVSGDVLSEQRKRIFCEMRRNPYGNDKDEEEDLEEFWNRNISELQMLVDGAKNGESIRIWYSEAPYSICGFYYVNSIFVDYNCKITAIKLPKCEIKAGGALVHYSSWGQIAPEEFDRFLPLEREVTKLERYYMAREWTELQKQTTPLRAVVNGQLTGVLEDFYDYFISLEIPNGEFTIRQLIGRVLGRYQFGIGDWWIAERIRNMIAEGQLEIIKDNKSDYKKILKKATV